MTAEWAARWREIGSRLIGYAQLSGVRHGNDLILHAPRRGACIRVALGEPGRARVDAEDLHIPCDWALSDDEPNHDLDQVVASIMDGDVEVTVTGAGFRAGTYSGSAVPEPVARTLPARSQMPDIDTANSSG